MGDDAWDLVYAERLALADFLTGLSADEWSTPSLCGEWSVQEVAAHLAFANTMPLRALFLELARDRLRANTTNARLARQWARRGPGEIVARLRDVVGAHSRTPVTRLRTCSRTSSATTSTCEGRWVASDSHRRTPPGEL